MLPTLARTYDQTPANESPAYRPSFNDKNTMYATLNKSAQSNSGRGPRRGAVAHVRCEIPIGYKGAPQIRPKSTRSRGKIPKSHYLLHRGTRPTYDAKRHADSIRHFSTMHWTDRQTHVRTHAPTDRSSTGKFDDYRPLHYENDAA